MSCFKNALISVSDKTNLLPLAQALIKNETRIISTGGTAQFLRDHQVPVTEVEDITHMKEQMGGRLKTLHPTLLGGILARMPMDEADLKAGNMPCIDIVIVNLYPFTETVQNKSATDADIIEKIDIGGPSLVRAAAKNFNRVWIITDPNDYVDFIHVIQNESERSLDKRRHYAKKAFQMTAAFDAAICDYFSADEKFATMTAVILQKAETLRYGENPHQAAALYSLDPAAQSLANAKASQGKALSFNNILDSDNAFNLAQQFNEPACVIVKHNNPCGVALGDDSEMAFQKAWAADPLSAFGSVIAFNHEVDQKTATALSKQFIEVIIAPHFDEAAKSILQQKTNLRLLTLGKAALSASLNYRSINGGVLVQDADHSPDPFSEFVCVTEMKPDAQDEKDAYFAWKVSRFVKSNAIVFAKEGQTLGIGAGQMSRVFSAQIAKMKADEVSFSLEGSWLGSDGFIPFEDTVEMAAKLKVRGIIQPGGSKRDNEVIACANRHQLIMLFTHRRHFWH